MVLDGSRVVEVGSHEALLAKGGQYAELYGIQAAGTGRRWGVEDVMTIMSMSRIMIRTESMTTTMTMTRTRLGWD